MGAGATGPGCVVFCFWAIIDGENDGEDDDKADDGDLMMQGGASDGWASDIWQ